MPSPIKCYAGYWATRQNTISYTRWHNKTSDHNIISESKITGHFTQLCHTRQHKNARPLSVKKWKFLAAKRRKKFYRLILQDESTTLGFVPPEKYRDAIVVELRQRQTENKHFSTQILTRQMLDREKKIIGQWRKRGSARLGSWLVGSVKSEWSGCLRNTMSGQHWLPII